MLTNVSTRGSSYRESTVLPAEKEVTKRSQEIAFKIMKTICLIDDLRGRFV